MITHSYNGVHSVFCEAGTGEFRAYAENSHRKGTCLKVLILLSEHVELREVWRGEREYRHNLVAGKTQSMEPVVLNPLLAYCGAARPSRACQIHGRDWVQLDSQNAGSKLRSRVKFE